MKREDKGREEEEESQNEEPEDIQTVPTTFEEQVHMNHALVENSTSSPRTWANHMFNGIRLMASHPSLKADRLRTEAKTALENAKVDEGMMVKYRGIKSDQRLEREDAWEIIHDLRCRVLAPVYADLYQRMIELGVVTIKDYDPADDIYNTMVGALAEDVATAVDNGKAATEEEMRMRKGVLERGKVKRGKEAQGDAGQGET